MTSAHSYTHSPIPTRDFDDFVGNGAVMRALYAAIVAAARTPCPILITGESGTGKDLTAQSLHRHSARAAKPFVRLNCATLTAELMDSEIFGHRRGAFTGALGDHAGLLARAAGGTLFLDEITELPAHLQAKLLHVLDNGHYRRLGDSHDSHADVRIIAATNRDISSAISERTLRADLYHRLSALHLEIPALRHRGADDIVRTARYLLAKFSTAALSSVACAWLSQQAWSGNVRELGNTLRHAATFYPDAPALEPEHFTANKMTINVEQPTPPSAQSLDVLERNAIEHAIARHHGNLRAAARSLGIDASTLHRKRKRWSIGQ